MHAMESDRARRPGLARGRGSGTPGAYGSMAAGPLVPRRGGVPARARVLFPTRRTVNAHRNTSHCNHLPNVRSRSNSISNLLSNDENRNSRNAQGKEQNEQKEQKHAAVRGDERSNSRATQRIPDEKFRATFGREHHFRVSQPVVVEGRPRFQYSGYWFEFIDTWPATWSYSDDCYIDYIDGQYFLINLLHPDVRLAVVVVL